MAGMVPRILVVEDEEHIRRMLLEILAYDGYEVIMAEDGEAGLELAALEHPDLILLDVWMPGMDGLEVLEKIRLNPAMEETPCIMMTAMDPSEGEQAAMDLAVDHYLTKPVEPSMVRAAVRSTLHRVGAVMTPIKTGYVILDKKALAGGIPVGSLTLIEGSSVSGKSVLSQQLVSGSLGSGHQVAVFTSEDTERSLLAQMNSINLPVSQYVAKKRLRIHHIVEPGKNDEPEELLSYLAMQIATLPKNYKAIFVDAITNLASISEESAIMSFFYACKNLCNMGRSIILVAHSSAFDEKLLIRLRSLCDAHFNMRVENAGARQVRVLEVSKIHNADLTTGDVVTFVVEPNIGMQIIPMNKVRA